MTIRTALIQGTALLAGAQISEPRLSAEVLLAHAMHRERPYFFAHPEQELREVEWLHYGRYLHERMKGKPTQYITQQQEFYGREFRVTPDVLIPRPETELLIETVLRLRPNPGELIDVGTGSGIIAVTMALESRARIIATDISMPALEVARSNAIRIDAAVTFVQADLLTGFADKSLDVVASNPPYVPEDDRASLQREVREWEPETALFAGPRGLAVYERLIPQARRVLKPGGLLALELGFGQADAVSDLVRGWRALEIFPDLSGTPRVLVCERL